ncbi:MAG TPA: hypothetical protein VN722_03650 [Hanamia sp.]|jgi:preprotein translocase subunit SecG|nr:hypothetical protein [Hanamia sp.]
MEKIKNWISTFIATVVLLLTQAIVFAQDATGSGGSGSGSSSSSTTTTTTTSSATIQPWMWVVGAIIVLIIIIALARGGSRDSVVVTKEKEVV